MSGMHLMPVYYTDTNLKKRKKRKVTASMQKAQAEQDKYLKKLGYVPLEQRQKEFKPLRPVSYTHLTLPTKRIV